MNEAFDWGEVWQLIGVGFGAVMVILALLVVVLRLANMTIIKIERWFTVGEKKK